MKPKNVILGVSAVVLVIIALFIFRMMGGVTLYKDEQTKGNTSGNLLNGGLFCEVDDTIYFANPAHGGTLYSMSSSLQKMKQVYTDNVSYLNAAGKYLFYTKRNDKKDIDSDALFSLSSTGLYRMSRKVQTPTALYKDATQVACLYGNYIYYQHYDRTIGLQFYKTKINGKDEKQLSDEGCAPTAIDNNKIYYTGLTDDHYIHVMSTEGGSDTVLYSGNCSGLSKQGNYLYFIDMGDDYQLKRMSVDGGEPETLVSKRIATYNVSPKEDVLYCQIDNGKDNGLYELNLNSHALNHIASGNYNYLHFTSNYLLYEEFDQSKVYALNLVTHTTKELNLPNGLPQ